MKNHTTAQFHHFMSSPSPRTFFLGLLVLFLGFLVSGEANAQQFDVKGMVKIEVPLHGTGKNENRVDTIKSGKVYLFTNKKAAKEALKKLNAYYRSNERSLSGFDSSTLDASSVHEVDFLTGEWMVDAVMPGGFIIFVTEEREAIEWEIEENKLEYTYTYSPSDQSIAETLVTASQRSRIKEIKPGPPWEDGDNIRWDISSTLSREYLREASRFMFVPKAYEYGTDSMVGHIPPAVYDTEEYARIQTRRKSFDYEVNDSLAGFMLSSKSPVMVGDSMVLDSTLILNDSLFICKYTFTFKMPDREKYYYYRGVRELEDYTHVYFADTVKSSHLRKKPWRFLVTDFAVQYGELADSLYEQPKSAVRNDTKTLALEFVKAGAVLIDSPKNDSIKAAVENDMRMYRNNLLRVTIGGSASPEGSMARNIQLANERADFAVRWLSSRYPGMIIQREEPKVYGWDAVVERLEQKGRGELANSIRVKMAAKADINRTNLAEWDETIEPILQELRTMSCSYLIRLSTPLSANEAVDKFLHDPDYKEGGSKSFSRGDYFNIYKNLEDTAKLEELTERIYRTEIKPFLRSRQNPFYAYVANRYMADILKRGVVDENTPKILDGFVNIDTLRGGHLDCEENGIMTKVGGAFYKINRSPHVANLALAYFNLKRYTLADTLAQLLPQTEKYQAIRKLTLLCARFLKSPEEAEPGLEFAWNVSPLSRSVLAVELRSKLGDREMKPDELRSLLWSLPDDEPRKWYLLGLVTMDDPIEQYSDPFANERKMLQNKRDKMEDEAFAAGSAEFVALQQNEEFKKIVARLEELGPASEAAALKDSLPNFAAYLQKAFDLDSSYYKVHYLVDYDFDAKVLLEKQKNRTATAYKKRKDYEFKYDPKLAEHYRKRFDDIIKYRKKTSVTKPKEDEALATATKEKDDEE